MPNSNLTIVYMGFQSWDGIPDVTQGIKLLDKISGYLISLPKGPGLRRDSGSGVCLAV